MPNDVFLDQKVMLMAANEATYGADAAPQHTNSFQAIKLIEPWALNATQEFVEQVGGLNTRGMSRPIATVRPVSITFRTYLMGLESGSYTANRKPPHADLLRACGAFETFVTSDANGRPRYTYAPGNDVGSDGSVTMVAHRDGYEHRFVGGRGNVNLIYGAAAPVIGEFTIQGQLTTEASTLRTGAPSVPTAIPPRWIGSGTVYVGSLQSVIEAFNFNTNNEVMAQRGSVASSGSGIVAIYLTSRQPGGSLDPEASQPTSHDFWGAFRSSSGAAVRLQCGDTQSQRFTLVMSQTVYKALGWGNKTGLSVFNIDYQAYEHGSGDNEWSLVFD